MKITAISVCVNYADFFQYSVAENKAIFDKWIIVTDLVDTEVTKLAEENGLTLIKTDAFYEKGIFNKYAGINEAIKTIPQDEDTWTLFLDSDICLQKETRRVLENLKLNKEFIYGVDRLNVVGYPAWENYKAGKGVLVENWMLTNAGLQVGSRLVHYYGHQGENGRFEGWRPLGFFQLCHRSQFDMYPENTIGADHCDLLFARQWPREKRMLIPEMFAIHLESENSEKAVNWYGRKSQPFTSPENLPDIVAEEVTVQSEETPQGDTITLTAEILAAKKKRTRANLGAG